MHDFASGRRGLGTETLQYAARLGLGGRRRPVGSDTLSVLTVARRPSGWIPCTRNREIRRNENVKTRVSIRSFGAARAGGLLTGAGPDVGRQAEHRRHHGRRHRLVQHRRLQHGDDGRKDAEPRPDRERGDGLHRLLRRGQLHGGSGRLRDRRASHSHGHDDGRPGRRGPRSARRGHDDRHRAQSAGLCHRTVRKEPPR